LKDIRGSYFRGRHRQTARASKLVICFMIVMILLMVGELYNTFNDRKNSIEHSATITKVENYRSNRNSNNYSWLPRKRVFTKHVVNDETYEVKKEYTFSVIRNITLKENKEIKIWYEPNNPKEISYETISWTLEMIILAIAMIILFIFVAKKYTKLGYEKLPKK